MRKFILSLAAAGSALALATPAAAQYYNQPYGQRYGGQPYGGYGSGYDNRGQLQQELQRIRYEADNLARQGRLTPYEARDLFGDIHSAERALYRANSPWEARALSQKIAHIRYELHRYADYDYGRRGYGYDGRHGYSGYDNDRDRDRDWDHDRD